MEIASEWKLTFNPGGSGVLLLDYDMALSEEPAFGVRKGLNVRPIPYGAPFLKPTLADVYEVTFGLIRTAGTEALARRAMLEALVALAAFGKAPMRLEIRNLTDRYYQWGDAFIHTPQVRRLMGGDPGASELRISFTAVSLAQVMA